MKNIETNDSPWNTTGKKIRKLISELQSFDDDQIEVMISIDGGATFKPISLVGKINGKCALIFYPK